MAILAIFSGDLTAAQYDELRAKVGWPVTKPAGGVFHCAAIDDSGKLRVADVWASPEDLDSFVQSNLMPAFAELQLAPPAVEIFAVHNIDAYEAVDQFKV